MKGENMKNFVGGEMETGPEVSRKKHRRARKPKFEVGKPKLVNDKKKKDKKVKQVVATQMAKLGLEAFPLIFAEIKESNRRLKHLNSKIDGYVLDKLAAWDAEDELRRLSI
ncbi:hypothetical protein QUC31_002595 [Theobroma cacao]